MCASQRRFNFLQLEYWENLSSRLFVMYLLKYAFLIALNIDNKLAPNRPSSQLHLRQTICLSILSLWEEPSPQPFHWLRVCVFCMALHRQGDNDGRQSGSCLPRCFSRFLCLVFGSINPNLSISDLNIFIILHTHTHAYLSMK